MESGAPYNKMSKRLATALALGVAIAVLALAAQPSGAFSPVPAAAKTPTPTPTPNLCAAKPCYFIALRLADQRIPAVVPAEQPLIDNLAKHLSKLKNNLKGILSNKTVYVYQNSDIHVSIQLLQKTSPLSAADKTKLTLAMASVRSQYRSTLLDLCEELKSGSFEVWKNGFIVYHIATDDRLTRLMKSVNTALKAQNISVSSRKDFPGGGHYSVGNFDTTGSAVYKDLNTHFQSWDAQKNQKDKTQGPAYVYYMRPPACRTFIPPDLSLMIRDKNPAGAPPFARHYRVEETYPLQ